ncbi:hypothetical protein QY97_00011 [Bacillus thermotolerans]|uniref:Uncharacterized protein n=1 Tax=Bacillus thermotolerans TaxID=1221996 RepID=A0A0F5I0D0_BACTR|nr:hypothetical protein QY97_00011 [Bacillus thermotolerans]KKB41604.1 hypothetical protein QY96_01967 [Bacillus thermotolerans]KKB42729.1 hypothetical protein QY95_03750 [Bacillus thermotolerans]
MSELSPRTSVEGRNTLIQTVNICKRFHYFSLPYMMKKRTFKLKVIRKGADGDEKEV